MLGLLFRLLLCLLLSGCVSSAWKEELPLEVRVGDSAGLNEAEASILPNPGWRNRVLSTAQPSATLWIRPLSGHWPVGEWVLQMNSSPLLRFQLQAGNERSPWTRGLNPVPGVRAGHGDVAFLLAALPSAGTPLKLNLDSRGVMVSTVALRLLPAETYRNQNAAWLAYAGASLAVMLTMALMALIFSAYLRDSSLLWYAGYLLAYLWILGLQSGFLAAPLGLVFSLEGVPLSGRFATAAAVICAVMFLDRFGQLSVYAPRLRGVLHLSAGLFILAALATVLPFEGLVRAGRSMTNPLFVLGGPLLLFTALWAAWQGSRYALIFAIGWAPLLTVTVMGSLQLFGQFGSWLWLENARMGAGAFEAFVLAAGLAYRSLELRRERDSARQLADIDPLTGLLNRRSWSERVRRLMLDPPEAPSVLFIDIDHFKQLNDSRGHDVGDWVLKEVAACLERSLRAQDLLGRHGGEEMVAALPRCGLDAAARIAEQLRRDVSLLRIDHREASTGEAPKLTVSIGVAQQRTGESLESLLRRADAAMYAAKHAGRDRVVVDGEEEP
jgi:diguanylate cyclase (GGDEF)-like protein